MRFFLTILIALGAVSCNTPYMGKDLCGADEFVMDSYKIREGKFSILEMEGKTYDEIDEDFLVEYQDRIHEDDLLEIALYHPKRLDLIEAVKEIGKTVEYRGQVVRSHSPIFPLSR